MGGLFFHSKGTWGCSTRQRVHFFKLSSLAKGIRFANFSPFSLGKGMLFGNFSRFWSGQWYAFWQLRNVKLPVKKPKIFQILVQRMQKFGKFCLEHAIHGTFDVEISLAKGIVFTKIGLANGSILKLWAAHPYPPEI